MNLNREFAIWVMRFTQAASKLTDFLDQNGIATPMPVVEGAIPEHARVFFPSFFLKGLTFDLMVIWTIGDFPESVSSSTYYDPESEWYNVFYGAYGVLSHETDGSFWGYESDGTLNLSEMIEVPELDYNYLTAGQLGCPENKQVFQTLTQATAKEGQWDTAELTTEIPSGLHKLQDSINANPLYYTIFGLPHSEWADGHESYEKVKMRGKMFFRPVHEVQDLRITLVWGAMCPATDGGGQLLGDILKTMAPFYL